MSNYPPYQVQPYGPQYGPYMPPQGFQGRQDMQGGVPMPQPQQGPQTAPQGPVVGLSAASRPVTSREEAQAVGADFSGALMMFPDITHNRVYVKRWDGAAGGPVFTEYAPVLPPAPQAVPQQETPSWASVQEVQDIKDLVDKLQAEVDRLKKPAARGGKPNDADGK